MDWSRRLRIMEKLAWEDSGFGYGGATPADIMTLPRPAPPAAPTPSGALMRSDMPQRSGPAKTLAFQQATNTLPQFTPAAGAPPAASPVAPAGAPPADAWDGKIPKGKGYIWLASKLNAERPADQHVDWRQLRTAMGGQMLYSGAAKPNYNYRDALKDVTPDVVKSYVGAKKPGHDAALPMPWHKMPDGQPNVDALRSDMEAGRAMMKRQHTLLEQARRAKAEKRYAPAPLPLQGAPEPVSQFGLRLRSPNDPLFAPSAPREPVRWTPNASGLFGPPT